MKIAVITLGCPKNLVDTEVMLGLLANDGHEFAADAGDADMVIVSTCSFISAAVLESRAVVDECLELKRAGAVEHVVVAGCLPQRYANATWEMFPGVDAVVGCSDFEKIANVVREVASGRSVYKVGVPDALYDERSPRVRGTPAHIAYVKIAEGCGNCCSYCTIPSIRGALRSRTLSSVVREVVALVDGGVREINLIAQDTTAYGTDFASDVTLPALLFALADTGVPWIRILYTHPAHVTDELLYAMSEVESVVPYLDMPVSASAPSLGARARRFPESPSGVRSSLASRGRPTRNSANSSRSFATGTWIIWASSNTRRSRERPLFLWPDASSKISRRRARAPSSRRWRN
jgi:ribosomal protein S12 methylthiotransferase